MPFHIRRLRDINHTLSNRVPAYKKTGLIAFAPSGLTTDKPRFNFNALQHVALSDSAFINVLESFRYVCNVNGDFRIYELS